MKASRPAAKISSLRSAWARSPSLMMPPRAVLIRIAVGFMILNWDAEIIFSVEGVRGTWIVTISLVVKSSSISKTMWIEVLGMAACQVSRDLRYGS